MSENRTRVNLLLFFLLVGFVALGAGLSDSIYSNYFKDAYRVNAIERAFIEFPRELPGLLCAVVVAALGMLGDMRIAAVAQALACAGLTALGLLTPPFGVMLIFLFVNSMGLHLFMPLQDSIGMALAEPGIVGKRMGQYGAVKTGVSFLAALLAFWGFRSGVFSFTTPVKAVFLIGAAAYAAATAVGFILSGRVTLPRPERRRVLPVFRKAYRYYYALAVLGGVQKQIAYVFGSWVIVDMLGKGADVMSLLIMAAGFGGMFFLTVLGKWLDRFGVKRMMYFDALSFIAVYALYGLLVWGIAGKALPEAGWPVWALYLMFVLDRLSMQFGLVRAVYLRGVVRQSGAPESEITSALSTGISLDHIVAIVAAQLSGLVWTYWGPQWVFFLAALFSLGNLFVAWRIRPADYGEDDRIPKEALKV